MRRIAHGSNTPPSDEKSSDDVRKELGKIEKELFFPEEAKQVKAPPFIRMFEGADSKKCLIPDTDDMLASLSELGKTMLDRDFDSAFDSALPAAYTYFAQFVNHDINFTNVKKLNGETDFQLLASEELGPWTDQMIFDRVSNKRTGMLELECLYGAMQANVLPPRQADKNKMALGTVFPSNNRPSGVEGNEHDVVRGEMSPTLNLDRTALIGDRRNDSNIILSQLHVAFLKAHNAIVDRKACDYETAKQILQKHYHCLILEEFLPAIVPKEIIQAVKDKPRYNAAKGLPLEFSVGAFRFGHSMVRRSYYYNQNFPRVSLAFLFTLAALSKHGGSKPTPNEGPPNLPEDRIIQWENFIGETAPELHRNKARKLRTQMVEPLSLLLDEISLNIQGERSLAVQDLKRSFMLRIPTGQAIAEQLEVEKPLTSDDLKKLSSPAQFDVLEKAGMTECTPLSFYVLAEAASREDGKLGEVGGRIVAEVLIGQLRDRPDSIIGTGWQPDPELGARDGKFVLSDLLRLAGVLGGP